MKYFAFISIGCVKCIKWIASNIHCGQNRSTYIEMPIFVHKWTLNISQKHETILMLIIETSDERPVRLLIHQVFADLLQQHGPVPQRLDLLLQVRQVGRVVAVRVAGAQHHWLVLVVGVAVLGAAVGFRGGVVGFRGRGRGRVVGLGRRRMVRGRGRDVVGGRGRWMIRSHGD